MPYQSPPTRSLTAADDACCSICLEKFVPGQWARTLPCQHFFHKHCIDLWLTESSCNCPDDNQPVLLDEGGEEEQEAGES